MTDRDGPATRNTVTVPLVHVEVEPEHLAFFGALGLMAALDIIEWPLAAVIVAGQVIATRGRRRIVREMASGVEEAL